MLCQVPCSAQHSRGCCRQVLWPAVLLWGVSGGSRASLSSSQWQALSRYEQACVLHCWSAQGATSPALVSCSSTTCPLLAWGVLLSSCPRACCPDALRQSSSYCLTSCLREEMVLGQILSCSSPTIASDVGVHSYPVPYGYLGRNLPLQGWNWGSSCSPLEKLPCR